jgi:hypothetical protein
MGDSDRMKRYISDYLDHTLDPSTQKEFEHALGKNEELRTITSQVARIKNALGNLAAYHCSENFNVALRERIVRDQNVPVRYPIKKYALSVSFAAVLVVIFFILNPFTSEDSPKLQQITAPSGQYPQVNNPASMQNIGTAKAGNGSYDGTDIKTRDEAKAYTDSSRDKSLPEMRQVDKKEIKETRP